jgi:hypothetical protein
VEGPVFSEPWLLVLICGAGGWGKVVIFDNFIHQAAL